jgi:hypothetical protein
MSVSMTDWKSMLSSEYMPPRLLKVVNGCATGNKKLCFNIKKIIICTSSGQSSCEQKLSSRLPISIFPGMGSKQEEVPSAGGITEASDKRCEYSCGDNTEVPVKSVTTRYTGKSQVDKVRIFKNSKLRRKEV